MEGRILIVDDETTNLKLLREILHGEYSLAFAKNGLEALRLARSNPPDLVLLDIMMPEMDGYTVCKKLKEDPLTRDIPVIFVSALSKETDEIEGFKYGAVDYITKPIRPAIVKVRVKNHLTLKQVQQELSQQKDILEQKVAARTMELTRTQQEVVERLGMAAEYRDPETGDHIYRMSHYTYSIGKIFGLPEKECKLLLQASPMHDIGKVGIPDSILLKQGRLTKEEWEVMKTHTEIGGRILSHSNSELLQMAQTIAMTHHEKWDGSGYPKGLKGDKIPLCGRMVAIADVFDALTSKRPYKTPWPVEQALNLIKEESGRHFDPELVKMFLEIIPEILEIKEEFPI